jgi:hypothetical protein
LAEAGQADRVTGPAEAGHYRVTDADVIKTIVKLALVALIANATWQAVNAYWPHYKFEDAVRSTVQFRGDRTNEQLRARILELAVNYDVPVGEEDIEIRREEAHTIVDVSYVRQVNLAPGYTYRWPFTLHVDTFSIGTAVPGRSTPK